MHPRVLPASPAASTPSRSALERIDSLPTVSASPLLPDGTALAAGAQGRIWLSLGLGGGHIWRRVATLPGRVSRLASQSGVVVARVHGRLDRSRDGGRTWNPVGLPILAPVVGAPG